ncbi:MAG: hypothetical protein COB67_05855 [SAR324 cluster bacterium]|uniref:Uncharacterized protein n=1 Tax=SAR324 cluster bacterium TaxID=2024889 RepID=A0A2A4T664_9DELT|nr:MAG: hypothetical protein COB67_05855 [SAR324 cluster bacterium]
MSLKQTKFEDIKQRVVALLSFYSPEKITVDENMKPFMFYLADLDLNNQLNNLRFELESTLDDELDLKKYGFHKIVKFYNPGVVSTSFFYYFETKWKQVNDPQKVKNRLEEEYTVWANSYKAHSFEQLDRNSSLDAEFLSIQKSLINKKIAEKRKILLWLQNNFDSLDDIRVCSKERANDYGSLRYELDGKRITAHLSSKLPSVLYYEKQEYRKNNKVDMFLAEAKNAFGDVYFISSKADEILELTPDKQLITNKIKTEFEKIMRHSNLVSDEKRFLDYLKSYN